MQVQLFNKISDTAMLLSRRLRLRVHPKQKVLVRAAPRKTAQGDQLSLLKHPQHVRREGARLHRRPNKPQVTQKEAKVVLLQSVRRSKQLTTAQSRRVTSNVHLSMQGHQPKLGPIHSLGSLLSVT